MVKAFKLLTIKEVRKLQGWTFASNADDLQAKSPSSAFFPTTIVYQRLSAIIWLLFHSLLSCR